MAASPYVRAIWLWRFMVARCRSVFSSLDSYSARVLNIRYEDLVADPIGQGEAIARHLELRLTPRARKRLQGAHARSIGAHRRRAPEEIREAENIAGSELRALGYQLASAA